jgi:MFS transporter, OFA family, oxalate/formate antiporter
VVFGFAFGGLSNLMASIIGDTFGMTNLGAITSTLVVGFSLGAAIGPSLGGFIFDATQSYFISFLVGAGAAALAVVFLALTRRESQLKIDGF